MAVLYAGAEWIGPAYPDNFLVGRQGNPVTGIVDHHSVSTLQGLIARFTTSSGVSGGGVSAHFAIDRDGTRYQIVDTADTAFHAGNFLVNLTTIGIEHIRQWGSGPGTPGYEPITDAQYQSSHELHVILATDNGFPLDLSTVHPHRAYIQTTCPGDLDLNRIITPTEVDMTPAQEAKLDAVLLAVKGGGEADAAGNQTDTPLYADLKRRFAAITTGGGLTAAQAKQLADLLTLAQKTDGHFTGK